MAGKKSRSNRQPNPSGFNQGGGDEGASGPGPYGDGDATASGLYYQVEPSYHGDPAVPRSYQGGDGIADLASGMGQMQLEEPTPYGDYDQYPNGYAGGDTQAGTDGLHMGHSTYMQYDGQPQYSEGYYAAGDKGKQPAEESGYPNYDSNYHGADDEPHDEVEYARAIQESQQAAIRGTYRSSGDADPSSYDHVEEEPEPMPSSSSLSPYTTQPSSFVITEEHDFVSNPNYKREHSRKYQPGAVFKTLWAEPHGQAPTTDHPISEVASVRTNLENFYIGIRRFIVVASDRGHSSCVPILTYYQRGCRKPGIDPLKHGIIHTKGSRPRQLEDEPNMGFAPVALKMSVKEKLAKESRVNYSKIVSVEHVTKVYFIGHIEKNDFKIVKQAVDTCWFNKNHGTY